MKQLLVVTAVFVVCHAWNYFPSHRGDHMTRISKRQEKDVSDMELVISRFGDSNKDNTFSLKEIYDFFKYFVGLHEADAMAAAVNSIKFGDTNNDGKLSAAELTPFLEKLSNMKTS